MHNYDDSYPKAIPEPMLEDKGCCTRKQTILEALENKIKLAHHNLERLQALRNGLSGEYLSKPVSQFPTF